MSDEQNHLLLTPYWIPEKRNRKQLFNLMIFRNTYEDQNCSI